MNLDGQKNLEGKIFQMEETEKANTLENVVHNQVKMMKREVTQCGRNVEKEGNLLRYN